MWTAKTLIKLGGCPGRSESSLGAHATLLILSCCCANFKNKVLFCCVVSSECLAFLNTTETFSKFVWNSVHV